MTTTKRPLSLTVCVHHDERGLVLTGQDGAVVLDVEALGALLTYLGIDWHSDAAWKHPHAR